MSNFFIYFWLGIILAVLFILALPLLILLLIAWVIIMIGALIV